MSAWSKGSRQLWFANREDHLLASNMEGFGENQQAVHCLAQLILLFIQMVFTPLSLLTLLNWHRTTIAVTDPTCVGHVAEIILRITIMIEDVNNVKTAEIYWGCDKYGLRTSPSHSSAALGIDALRMMIEIFADLPRTGISCCDGCSSSAC